MRIGVDGYDNPFKGFNVGLWFKRSACDLLAAAVTVHFHVVWLGGFRGWARRATCWAVLDTAGTRCSRCCDFACHSPTLTTTVASSAFYSAQSNLKRRTKTNQDLRCA